MGITVKHEFRAEVDDLSLLQAALLTFDIEPFSLDGSSGCSGGLNFPNNLPDDFPLRIESLRSSIRTDSLRTNAVSYDEYGQIDEYETRIKTDDFIAWCNARRLPHNIPGRPAPQNAKWPWGEHETKLLRELAAAANKFWKNYDPTDPTTAPTNEQVSSWLIEHGVAKRSAELIATMLRDDDLRPGPRR